MDYFRTSGFLLLLWLLSLFQGFITDTIGQSCSCENDGNCNFTNQCVPEGDCRKENVALGKAANISSVYDKDGDRSGPACLAVNGNTDTTIIYASSSGKPNCVKSSATENNASWTVDLGKNYTITNITLYTEKSYPGVTGGLQIIVDGTLCYEYPQTLEGKEREDIQCIEPVTGRNVKLYSTRNFYMFFCEVQVWVCKAGLYGNDCDHVCHCKDVDACDNYYGTCTTACIDGYYGHNCSLLCGNCLQGQCDKINGSCLNGCEAGWMNTTCEEECKPGYYGPNCNTSCGNCSNDSSCNKTTGTCPGGCNNGWKPPNCKQTCDNGTYGPNCSITCGSCTNDTPCDKVNGTCVSCKPGWIPPLCREACSNGSYGQNCNLSCGNCFGGVCNKTNGSCPNGCEAGWMNTTCKEECHAEYYGPNCENTCGECVNNSICNKTTGVCPHGCNNGWTTPYCNQTCRDGYYGQNCSLSCGNCFGGVCNKTNGSCPNGCEAGWMNTTCKEECHAGHYGPNCSNTCGECVNGSICNKTTGVCPLGCNNGWTTTYCNQTCVNGTYGPNCNNTCGNCANGEPCDRENGKCLLCKPGWIPPICQEACNNGTFGQNCSDVCGNCTNGEPCDQVNGYCLSCEPGLIPPRCQEACNNGTYGQHCSYVCGNCTKSEPCDKINGECLSCEPGLITPLCQQECTNGTYGQNCSSPCGNCTNGEQCDTVDGHCLSCDPGLKQPLCQQDCDSGTYGQNCSNSCGRCTDKKLCDKIKGTCFSCKPGWNLPLCTEACANGTYGQNCSGLCGNCTNGEACDKVDGKCRSCVHGMEPPFCQLEVKANNDPDVESIVGGVVGGVAGALGVIIVIVFIRRRQNQRKNAKYGNIRQEMNEHIYHEPTCNQQSLPANDENRSNVYENISNSINNSSKNKIPSAHNANTKIEMKPFCAVSPSTGSSQQDYSNVERLPLRRPEIPPKPIASNELMEPSSTTDDITDDSDVTYSNDNVYSTYQSHNALADLDNLQRNLLESLKSDQHARKQFQKLRKGMVHPHTVGSMSENLKKNRFKALCPYDNTRVKIQRIENDLGTDYINASYIRGYDREKAYIAAQGPRDHTVDDTWLMIWHENVTQIVMLTNLKESGKEKCTQYWPPVGTTLTYGHVTVTNQNEKMRADFVIRTFSIKFKGKPFQRQVEQYNYISWSDHGVPSASSLVNFWRYVKERGLSTVPLLVHCSAGVGRTGTYIALDIAMETATQELEVNVFKIVTKLREDRATMVQTESQYRFLYEAILEAYTSRNTRLTMEQFDVMVTGVINVHESNEVIDKEFKMLQQMGEYLPKPRHEMAESQENKTKNRHPDTLPDDNYLAYLSNHLKGRNFYINAVFLSSFKHLRGILLTQLPLPDTLVDIWRLIEDKEVNTVVSIGSKDDHKTVKNFCQYWPRTAGEKLTTGPYTITLTSSVVLNDHLTSYHLSFKAEVQTRDIQLLHYTNWVGEVPDETSDLIQLVEKLNASHSDNDKSPILVQCIDGMAKSGLFCVLLDVISRASCDQEIDIYLTARHVQTVRRRAVTSEVQYRYCYKVAQDYFRQAGVYQNM